MREGEFIKQPMFPTNKFRGRIEGSYDYNTVQNSTGVFMPVNIFTIRSGMDSPDAARLGF